MKWSKRIISTFTAAVLAMSSVVGYSAVTSGSEVSASSSVDFEQADNIQNGVILHCWNWSYNNIKKYLPQIAAAGYTAVQTSPVTQPKDYYWQGVAYGNVGIPDGVGGYDGNWWKMYQPVAENICDNGYTWGGTKDEFKSMCDEAEKYGIKVVVDIVANHMGNINGWKIGSVEEVMGDISPQVGQFWNPDMLTDPSYWHISTSWVHSSDGRFDVTQGNMGMPDLNTGDSKVQKMILDLLKECIDNGADGFRFDAAKHIETPKDNSAFASDFWDVVLDGTTSYAQSTKGFKPYYYGEVLNRIDDNAAETYYLSKMSVTDNSTGDNIRNTLKYGGIGGASNPGYCGYAHGQGNKVVLWAESHDTYMGGGSSYDSNDSTINKAWAIVASRKDSTGLYFARPYYSYERLEGDVNGYDARKDPAAMAKEIRQTQMGEVGSLTWMDPCVAEVNRFRNHFIGQSESLGSSDDSLFYNVRGKSGVVLVSSKGPCDVNLNLQGKMANGTYTDQVTGNKFVVSGGTIKGTIANEDGIAVVYNTTSVPRNTIEAPRENFAAESIDITVGLNNAASGTYSINGSAPVTYTKDTTFSIGAGDAVGTEYVIKLSATDGTNSTSATYTFTKESKDVTYPTEPGYTVPVTTQPKTTVAPATTQPKTTVAPVTTQPVTQPQSRILIGDADLNKSITITDATAIQMHSAEMVLLTGDALTAADANKDGEVNVKDATMIQYYLADLPVEGSYCGTYIGGDTPIQPSTQATQPATASESNYLYYKNTNNWSTVKAYYWSDENTTMTSWPGVLTENIGNNVYRVNVPSDATMIIFNDGGSNKTGDLKIEGFDKIFANGAWSDYNGDTPIETTAPVSGDYVYYYNSNNWSTVNAYYWSDENTTMTSWPGVAMESVGNNVYRIKVPSDATEIIFNNGSSQTGDIVLEGANKIYKDGSWSAYTE